MSTAKENKSNAMYTLGKIILLQKFKLFNLLQKIDTCYEDCQKHALAFTNHSLDVMMYAHKFHFVHNN